MAPSAERLEATSDTERLQKIIAQAGLASRREAEEWIEQGLVTVNGQVAKLGDKAVWGKDAIKVKGKLIHFSPVKVYYIIYKPKNVIAMITEDEEGRATLKDLIQNRINERVFTVGRMDFSGEGAILLTNDGDLSQKILKSPDIIRRYHVKVDRIPTQDELARLARGGRIEGRSMNPFHVRLAQTFTRNALIEISFEGMGSIDVRKFFENKGFYPEKVARVGIGHINAEKLPPGAYKKLASTAFTALLEQPELAKKQIERMISARNKKVRVVREDELEMDAERKRRGKEGAFSKELDDPRSTRNVGERKVAAFTRSRPGDQPRSTFGSNERREPRTSGFGSPKPESPRGHRPTERGGYGERNPTSPPRNFGDRPARSFGGEKPAGRGFGGDRPAPRSYSAEKPAGRGFGGDRPARSYHSEKPANRGYGEERPSSRSFSSERPAGGRGGERPSGGRSSFGDKPAGRSFGRPSARPSSGRPSARPGGRPQRSEGRAVSRTKR